MSAIIVKMALIKAVINPFLVGMLTSHTLTSHIKALGQFGFIDMVPDACGTTSVDYLREWQIPRYHI